MSSGLRNVDAGDALEGTDPKLLVQQSEIAIGVFALYVSASTRMMRTHFAPFWMEEIFGHALPNP